MALFVDLEPRLCYSATATSRVLCPNYPFNLSFEMSAVTKGLRRSTSRAATRRSSPKSAAKRRIVTAKIARPKAKKAIARKVAPRKPTVTAQKSVAPRVKTTQKLAAVRAPRPATIIQAPPRQPTVDEAAALKAFERAHKEFTRGRFGEARNQFRALLDKYFQVSEVAARARTYLAVADARLRTESILPRDADSLFDRGVIELNRGEYVAAQEMFER